MAIARALINNPQVLLLDEPLGALDLQLRRAMQAELKRLQKKLGITFIYITHDQEEAINMSDRIAVMNHGTFEQIGTPDEIYNHPKTSYVATFVGNANILKGKAENTKDGKVTVAIAGGHMAAACEDDSIRAGESVTLAVRSENIRIQEEGHVDCRQKWKKKLCSRTASCGFKAGAELELELEPAVTGNRCKSGTGTDNKCLLRTGGCCFCGQIRGGKE